jgi:CubicO group peptidase (beta-lactamase class C family)
MRAGRSRCFRNCCSADADDRPSAVAFHPTIVAGPGFRRNIGRHPSPARRRRPSIRPGAFPIPISIPILMMISRFSVVAAALAALAAASPALAQRGALAGFDEYVLQAMRTWEVPGAAVAIVRGDSVILSRGYGVRQIGRPEAVDDRTLFAIGSSSKAFTAALVGMLVDEGKARWDDPVIDHLPGFRTFDPYVNRQLTLRDLLTHRSGLSRGDLTWYGTENDRAELVRRLRWLEPSWGFRSQFGYQNLMYVTAGEVVAAKMGRSWDDAVRERILAPLGMTATSTSVRALRGQANVATPHGMVDDTVRALEWRVIDNAAAAGSINSSVVDMARWVRFQLDSARVAGKPLLSASTFAETHMPQTVIRREAAAREANPFTHFSSYGLGWFLDDYRGRELVHHGGNIDGMSALVAMMPGEDVGVVVLTNMNATPLPTIVMRTAFDRLLGERGKDWSADLRRTFEKQRAAARETERRADSLRVRGTTPSLPLAAYAGTYEDSLYGEVKVTHEGGRLVATRGPAFVGDLEHWHYNTFRARWRNRALGSGMLNFSLGFDGKPAQVELENVGEFRRVEKVDTTAAVRLDAAALQRLTGSFRAADPPITIQVELLGDVLKLNFPGQPPYTLVAVTPTRFRVTREGMPPGFFVDYTLKDGRVESVRLEQPAPRPSMTLTPVR